MTYHSHCNMYHQLQSVYDNVGRTKQYFPLPGIHCHWAAQVADHCLQSLGKKCPFALVAHIYWMIQQVEHSQERVQDCPSVASVALAGHQGCLGTKTNRNYSAA